MRHAARLMLVMLVLALGLVACQFNSTPGSSPGPSGSGPGERASGERYDIGAPALTTIYVDPVHGNDSHGGRTRATALQHLDTAWRRIPQGHDLRTGVRLALMRGSYPVNDSPNYWESRHGTMAAPVLLESVDGVGAARLPNMNVFDVHYFYLVGVNITSPNDMFHCEQCDHLLLRNVTLNGVGDVMHYGGPHEGLKLNQSQHVYIEDSDISGANDNSIDMVAVQYGHVIGNKIHRSLDWCFYTKGGSAYMRIEGNEIYDCGTGGYTAGQGTGFQFMTAPWINYEAYDVKFVNNIMHDTQGAAFGVAGSYNILIAYNTAYRVGSRSQVIDLVRGWRGCDGAPDDAGAVAACQARLDQHGWGTTGEELEIIPNRNVFVFDNVIDNPNGFQSATQQFQIHACMAVNTAATNVPSPSRADTNLVVKGNVIWNGPHGHPLGVGGDSGCRSSNPTCNAPQLVRDNAINTVEPHLVDPAHGNFRLVPGSDVANRAATAIPDFDWTGLPAGVSVPPGNPSNTVGVNFTGDARAGAGHPGAF